MFNATQLANLCEVDRAKIDYFSKKGVLPSGVKDGHRLEWTLPQARVWVKKFRTDYLRDTKTTGAVSIAIANFKGGVGKTLIAANLGIMLSREANKKVVLVDLDLGGANLHTCIGAVSYTHLTLPTKRIV